MVGVELFFALAQGVYFWVVYFWPVTLVLAALWVLWAAAAARHVLGAGQWRVLALGCLAPFAFPLVILICGTLFAAPPSGQGSPARLLVGQTLVVILLLAQLPLAAVSAKRFGERWPVVATSWICGGYLSLMAGAVSWMAVTGDWL
ncbi:hypothetical protein [Fimbriiglobus ruber]|uniref:Uncharacterized protein n=1 Tax=Fimbriiglobus ruber TaxID=1908690 RepID=A0A225DVQ9_9BACT|nr:hypothetical protein [Fimbriiglobus ruber]OWK45461.1 hypothetical protein FRUB_01792 [Fimbriiglobus ruber]